MMAFPSRGLGLGAEGGVLAC
eukprot:COSAG02_NODE_23321_length_722_cov_1.242376_1_plen_20_part_10